MSRESGEYLAQFLAVTVFIALVAVSFSWYFGDWTFATVVAIIYGCACIAVLVLFGLFVLFDWLMNR